MSQFGFVYLLVNDHMPDLCKIGCTERSPHARAEELSKATGVPSPFKVICYIEVDNFQAAERKFHKWLADRRVSQDREFFLGVTGLAVRLMAFYKGKFSFTGVDHGEPFWVTAGLSADPEFLRDPFVSLAKKERDAAVSGGTPEERQFVKLVANNGGGPAS